MPAQLRFAVPSHHRPFVKPNIQCHRASFPNYHFFSFLSTFTSNRVMKKKQKKKQKRRSSSLLYMKYELFISQACHINKGSILGVRCKEEELKQCRDKKCKNQPQMVKEGREEQLVLAKWTWPWRMKYALTLPSDTLTSTHLRGHSFAVSAVLFMDVSID